MTTDAKIGLLLGLVFIVIIAFVINGLPGIHKSSPSSDTANYVTTIGNKPIGLPSGQPPLEQDNNTISAPIATATDKTAANGQSPITQVNNVITTNLPLQETEVAVGPERPEGDLSQGETTATPTEQAVTEAVPDKTQPASATYVVKKGDNLGLIAQNCYGTQGAKKENVAKIAKANHLKSNQIYVGQKLVIPADLTKSNPSMFETVKNTAISAVSQKTEDKVQKTEDKGQKTGGTRDYVVKSGDYPWKIAAKELGSGTRFKEILKYNPGITEKTTLSVGMHLKLPSK